MSKITYSLLHYQQPSDNGSVIIRRAFYRSTLWTDYSMRSSWKN